MPVLRRIELSNFMSHTRTVIEPSAGLTVLVGPNNCGKSAVVVALQILASNDNSTYVMRHGTKESRILVETDDDHTVEWVRKKSGGPAYVVDGERFDRLRNNVPDEAQRALRMGPVSAGTEGAAEFDLHFGSQKSPVFLLDQSGGTIAQFFASSSDAEKLVRMQQMHRDRVKYARSERDRLDAEAARVEREMEALTEAGTLAERAAAAETEYAAIGQLRTEMSELRRTLHSIARVRMAAASAAARATALEPLHEPPALHDTASLSRSITGLQTLARAKDAAISRHAALDPLREPPPLHDPGPLSDGIAALQAAHARVAEKRRVEAQAEAALAEATARVERWVNEQGRCPYCGGALSVDQVLAGGSPGPGDTDG